MAMASFSGASERRIFEFILEAGTKLECRATTVATAVILSQRFLKKLPPTVSQICPYTSAAACLCIAGKAEENFIKVRDVTNVCYRILNPDSPPLDVGEPYWSIREGIAKLELLVLRTLAFQVRCVQPHKFLLHYLVSLKDWLPAETWDKTPIASTAWTILRDSYVCPKLIINNNPQLMAEACLYLSLMIYSVEVPCADKNDRQPWWKIFYPDSSKTKLTNIVNDILSQVYDNDKK